MHAKRVDEQMQQGVAHVKVNEANKARGIYPEQCARKQRYPS